MKKRVVIIFAALVAVTLFIFFYKENLHCTQYTSVKLAMFEMRPHPEEELLPLLPLVYNSKFSWAIRAYTLVCVFAFLYLPIILYMKGSVRKKKLFVMLSIITLLFFMNIYIPVSIIGERIRALYRSVFVFGLFVEVVLYWMLIREKPKKLVS